MVHIDMGSHNVSNGGGFLLVSCLNDLFLTLDEKGLGPASERNVTAVNG